jgi:hypothetical protein
LVTLCHDFLMDPQVGMARSSDNCGKGHSDDVSRTRGMPAGWQAIRHPRTPASKGCDQGGEPSRSSTAGHYPASTLSAPRPSRYLSSL